jgi:hypothetical protein
MSWEECSMAGQKNTHRQKDVSRLLREKNAGRGNRLDKEKHFPPCKPDKKIKSLQREVKG